MPNFTRSDALRLLSEDKTSCPIPGAYTSIAGSALDNFRVNDFDLLHTVILPDTITSVGVYAFYFCRNLVTINLPNTITSLGVGIFDDCSSLLSIDLPNASISIPNEMFWGCSSLSSITVPPSVSTIGGGAFEDCRSLKSITIPDAVLNKNYGSGYYDPFKGYTVLIAKAQALNKTVREYLLHRNEMTRRRVTVLASLKTINDARILSRNEGRAFIWGNPVGIEGGDLNGVLAEERIPPAEMWREILEFF